MLPFFISWTDFKNSFGQIDLKKKTMLWDRLQQNIQQKIHQSKNSYSPVVI